MEPKRLSGVGLIVLLGALTAFAPMSIDMYLPAFPSIARDLGASTAAVQQTLAVFFLGMAGGQLIYGPLADRFGRKRPLMAGLALYVAAAVGCAVSGKIETLVWCRLFQALGGCAGIVIARAIVRDRFEPARAAQVFSELMLVMGIAPLLAPSLGGQMLIYASWRAIFWVLAGFGGMCLLAVTLFLEDVAPPSVNSLHPLAIGKVFGQVLKDATFLGPTLIVGFSGAAMFSYIMASPGVFIEHFGLTPPQYSILFSFNAAGLIGATQVNRRLLRHRSPYRLLAHAVSALAIAGTLVGAVTWTGFGGMWGTEAAVFALLVSVGFLGANGAACALAGQGMRAGSASALMGTLQYLCAAGAGWVASAIIAYRIVGTADRCMGMVIMFFALGALGLLGLFREAVKGPTK